MSQQKIKYGTEELQGNFTGQSFDRLPAILARAYDLEMPEDCEFSVDGESVEGSDIVEDNDSVIEIRAIAGKKKN